MLNELINEKKKIDIKWYYILHCYTKSNLLCKYIFVFICIYEIVKSINVCVNILCINE